jgi:hypothetical protein
VEVGHVSYRDITHHLSKVNAYTSLSAQHWQARSHASVGWLELIGRPLGRFCRMFILQGGWREGHRGLIIASIGAFYVFAKYAKLWELQHGCGSGQVDGKGSDVRTRNGSAITK